jgi:hypothetical protein
MIGFELLVKLLFLEKCLLGDVRVEQKLQTN